MANKDIKKDVKKAPKETPKHKDDVGVPKIKESSQRGAPSKVVNCNCIHEFQDKFYGVGKRLARRLGKAKSNAAGYKCTVCNRIH